MSLKTRTFPVDQNIILTKNAVNSFNGKRVSAEGYGMIMVDECRDGDRVTRRRSRDRLALIPIDAT